MASVAIAESKESISQNSPCESPMEWQYCSIVMWEFMDITIAYLDAQAFIIGSCSGKFTLGSGCYWVWWGHTHYLSTESHFTQQDNEVVLLFLLYCNGWIYWGRVWSHWAILIGDFSLASAQWGQRRHLFLVFLTYTVRMCSFELEPSQLRCVPIYSCSLSFLSPTLGIWCLPLAHCIRSVQAHNPCYHGAKVGPFLSHIESHNQHRPV